MPTLSDKKCPDCGSICPDPAQCPECRRAERDRQLLKRPAAGVDLERLTGRVAKSVDSTEKRT